MIGLIATALVLSASQQAADSAEAATGWHTVKLKTIINGEPQDDIHVAYTEDQTSPGMALYCGSGKLRVRFSLEGTDLRETLRDLFPRARYQTASLLLNGEAVETARFAYLPEHALLIASERSSSAKAFNAVVRGDRISVKRGRATHEIVAPPVDDAFRSFVDACKATGTI